MPFPPFPENEMTNQAAQTMPEPVTASMCLSSDYAKGWNDCLAALSQTAGVPDVLFDGYAVYQGMTDEARARINAGGVSDVLDSVVRLIRAQAAPAASGVHPDALQDGTRSKSTAKRVEALAAASVSERARVDALALDVAHRFTQDTDPQRRASLQVAVIAAIEQALTQQRGALEPIAWAATDYQADGPITQYTSDRYAAEYYESIGLDVRPLYATTPQPSADAVRELVKRWRGLADSSLRRSGTWDGKDMCDRIEKMADELESLLSGGSHA